MTISTTLLFSRAVNLMGQQQSDLAALQEKLATGKGACPAVRLAGFGSKYL